MSTGDVLSARRFRSLLEDTEHDRDQVCIYFFSILRRRFDELRVNLSLELLVSFSGFVSKSVKEWSIAVLHPCGHIVAAAHVLQYVIIKLLFQKRKALAEYRSAYGCTG